MAGAEAVMDIVSVPQAIAWQARHAEENGASGTARIICALLALEGQDSATARAIFAWQGLSLRDAMPLRIAAGLHNLSLIGAAPELAGVYAGAMREQRTVDRLVADLVARHDAHLLPWLDGPPQTNEAGRSASFAAALLWLAAGRTTARFALLEIGASAGINTMMGRYRYDLGGTVTGPADSPMRIRPEWRGPPPPATGTTVLAAAGCDIAPIDLADAAAALRLKSYVWPEAAERMARIDAAAMLARAEPPDLAAADAGDWTQARLAEPPTPGITRVLMHSVMWQYLDDCAQGRIATAIVAAGAAARADAPFAHLALETNRATFAHELFVRYWPGGGEPRHLATAHPHGAWIEWLA